MIVDGARLGQALGAVRSRIEAACRRSGRDASDVRLIAVTKTVGVDAIAAARDLGVTDFGENYAKELAAKASRIDATWHFVGKVQRGTAAVLATHADVVHSAEPGEGIARLAKRAEKAGRTIPCLVQVDYTGRRQGVAEEDVGAFVAEAAGLPGIRIIGLMTLPPPADRAEDARPYFARLRQLRDRLRKSLPEVRELSMGMSFDYEVAVEEGATMVRVGTALFGDRPVAPP